MSFAPQQTRALSALVMAEYLRAPGAITYLVLLLLAITALAFLCPRVGHRHVLLTLTPTLTLTLTLTLPLPLPLTLTRHVLWHISMASLLGSLTVLASKAVSTFAVQVRAALSRAVRPAVRPAVLPCALPPSLDRRRVHTVCADPRAH